MHNDVNQKLSMFIDDELSYDETQLMIKRIKSDSSLKAVMLRYQAISHALKTEEYQKLNSDFFEKVSQQVRQEATYLLPEKKSINPPRHRKMIAIAASTLVAAVIVGETIKFKQSQLSYQQLASTTSAANPSSLAVNQSATVIIQQAKEKPSDRQPMTKEFNDYLQAHNGSLYMNGGVGAQPYAKVAAYGQE